MKLARIHSKCHLNKQDSMGNYFPCSLWEGTKFLLEGIVHCGPLRHSGKHVWVPGPRPISALPCPTPADLCWTSEGPDLLVIKAPAQYLEIRWERGCTGPHTALFPVPCAGYMARTEFCVSDSSCGLGPD